MIQCACGRRKDGRLVPGGGWELRMGQVIVWVGLGRGLGKGLSGIVTERIIDTTDISYACQCTRQLYITIKDSDTCHRGLMMIIH